MARPKLRRLDQPWWIRLPLGLVEFAASLYLAVVLLFAAAAVLGLATVVESRFGLRAVHFGIYGTWWFTALNALLALNIFCAAAVRYPWKRHQTGFVITHIGLLTLMFGMLLSRRGGIDAQMPIWEGKTNHRAFEDSEHFELVVRSLDESGKPADRQEVIPIRFVGGPFNWQDFGRKLTWAPWSWARRDQGVVFNEDGIRVEVLDYFSNCRQAPAPEVTIRLSSPAAAKADEQGRIVDGPERFTPISLHVRPAPTSLAAMRPFGLGDRQRVGGGSLVFWLTGSDAEREAFLGSAPEVPLGAKGQVVLWAGGRRNTIDVAARAGQGVFPLEGTPLQAEVLAAYATAQVEGGAGELRLVEAAQPGEPAQMPAVELRVIGANQQASRLILFADYPELSQQAYDQQAFGSYWFDHGEKTSAELLAGQGGSRIDLTQAPGGALFYRYWNRHQGVVAAPLPLGGADKAVDAFKMPVAQLRMYAESQLVADRPETQVVPQPFNKDQTAADATRAARIRLTVDDETEERWVVGAPMMLVDQTPTELERPVVRSRQREVAVVLPLDEIDIGFQVRLKRFERKLDPGTSQAAHYGSMLDLVDRRDETRVLEPDVHIMMNAPIDFSDPESGRSYRLFQESFRGPYPAGGEIYRVVYGNGGPPEQAYNSVLTVNYDPGRGVKYVGCLLVVAGIVTMFYMRAYFFKPRPAPAAARPKTRERKSLVASARE